MKTTDVMAWGGSVLGLAPGDVLGMMDLEDPAWPAAINCIHIQADELNPQGPGVEPLQWILPVRPHFQSQYCAMARALLERSCEPGVGWHATIRPRVYTDESVFGKSKIGFKYTTGVQKFWARSSEISASMAAEIALNKRACFFTFDMGPIDKFNHRDVIRGNVTRPDYHRIAKCAVAYMERRHGGALISYRNHEGPWTLLALLAGYAALEKMEGK